MSRLFALLAALVLTPCLVFAENEPPEGFVALFNGKNLDGWHAMPHKNPDDLAKMPDEDRAKQLDAWMADAITHWSVDEGELVNDGNGPYLTTNKIYGNIEFWLDYKTHAKADSGIYLRTTPQVQIWDYTREGGKWNRGADKGSGGLFNNAQGSIGKDPLVRADKPFGEWNRFRILQVGEITSVWLNGHLVVDRTPMANYWNRSRPLRKDGRIQLQTHGGEIRWRNLFIREIGDEEAQKILSEHDESKFTTIFNGKDLTGWQGALDSYEVVDGAITCKKGAGGTLFTNEEYADFVVRLEIKIPPAGNNGLAIRYPGKGAPHVDGMCELQVLDNEAEKYAKLHPAQYHGSVYGMVAAHRGFLKPAGEWNYQEVTVRGSQIKVQLNGYNIVDADVSKVSKTKDGALPPGLTRKSGFFGFAGHNDPVAFRNIRIRRLGEDEVPPYRLASPGFRGHNSSGRAASNEKLPADISPEKHVVWKQPLPPGHSSPSVFEDRVYVTAIREKKLLTIAINRENGETIWEREAPYKELENIHRIGSYAQCTPATDGKHIVSLFGSSGLYCYDRDGELLWKIPMGPFNNGFGAGTSPIISGDLVILAQDHDTDSFLMAVNKKTGDVAWKTDRSEFPRNYCSPVIWHVDGKKQIVVAATLRVVGYDFESGKELWTVRGLSRAVCVTPVVGPHNNLYVAGWAAGGDETERIKVAPFDEFIKGKDANNNGSIERSELEKGGDIERRYTQVDRDKTGTVTKEEFEYYRGLFDDARNVVMAIKPGGTGDITKTHVLWQYRKFVPFCSSPLYANGYVFTLKDGGIFTSISAVTGEALQTKRLSGTGNYYASAVFGDNKVYAINQSGVLTVVTPQAEWKELATAEFGEDTYATPAIVDGRIYLRTSGHIYCFGPK